ncbi:MAG: hypothetical protein JWM39_43 [Parcubacteria group bacterium]|nr:hypothetical protein [Parcubacteria group bacterium]
MLIQEESLFVTPRPIGHKDVRIRLIIEQFPYDHDRVKRWNDMGFEQRYLSYAASHPSQTIFLNDFDGMTELLVSILTHELIEKAAA